LGEIDSDEQALEFLSPFHAEVVQRILHQARIVVFPAKDTTATVFFRRTLYKQGAFSKQRVVESGLLLGVRIVLIGLSLLLVLVLDEGFGEHFCFKCRLQHRRDHEHFRNVHLLFLLQQTLCNA